MVPANKLSLIERSEILVLVNSPDFVDLPPIQIYAQLLDAGIYLGSISTIYRVLNQNKQVKDRRRQARHPARAVHASESAVLAAKMMTDTFALHGTPRVVHADRGTSMTSKTVAALLADLEVTRSHSRPRVSNDNPFSEGWFKTLKYAPMFPERFGSIGAARAFMADFIDGYNHNHRHTGIGLNTPADVHYGLAAATAKDRSAVLATVRAANPHRFSTNSDPKILALPGTTWINKPLTTTEMKDPSTDVTLAA